MASPQSPRQVALDQLSRVPTGEQLGRFDTYVEAKNLVDRLLEGGLPPKALSIVGEHLRSVERITARYGYGRAALSAALTGSWVGLFMGLIVTSFGPVVSLSPLLAGAVIGAGLGMMLGIVLFSTQRATRRSFRSVQQIIAEAYLVLVDEEHHGKARRVIQEGEAK